LTSLRGWANYSLNSKADAKNDFENAMSLSERNAYVNYYYGMMLAGQKDVEKARTLLNTAIDVDLEGEISTLASAKLNEL